MVYLLGMPGILLESFGSEAESRNILLGVGAYLLQDHLVNQ